MKLRAGPSTPALKKGAGSRGSNVASAIRSMSGERERDEPQELGAARRFRFGGAAMAA